MRKQLWLKIIKKNLSGVSKISPERLLDEFKKLFFDEWSDDDWFGRGRIYLIGGKLDDFLNSEVATEAIIRADFYFKNTALSMIDRIKKETLINKIGVQNLSDTQYRVFLGPFFNIKTLQKAFNDVNVLQFENIEIIKNDKNN